MNKLRLFIIIFILLLLSAIFGLFYNNQKNSILAKKMENAVNILRSDVVPSIVSYGKVTSIEGRKITMSFNNDSITIIINEDAIISSLIGNQNYTEGQAVSDMSRIKVGDMLNVSLTVDENGYFYGDSVINFSEN